MTNLFEHLQIITVPATTETFNVVEKFQEDTSDKTEVKISVIEDDFLKWFSGKLEEPSSEVVLRPFALMDEKGVYAKEYIANVNGKSQKVLLSTIFSLLEKQGKGQEGPLFTNGYGNVFDVCDRAGINRTVNVWWDENGWHIRAIPAH